MYGCGVLVNETRGLGILFSGFDESAVGWIGDALLKIVFKFARFDSYAHYSCTDSLVRTTWEDFYGIEMEWHGRGQYLVYGNRLITISDPLKIQISTLRPTHLCCIELTSILSECTLGFA